MNDHAIPSPSLRPYVRAASIAVRTATVVSAGLLFLAMRAYPGGTAWDRASGGHDFWRNYLCDLMRQVALDGRPNPVGALYAQTGIALLAVSLVPFFWLTTTLFPSRTALARIVRVLSAGASGGAIVVALLPSDRFGALHGLAVVVAGALGLSAGILAVLGLTRSRERGVGVVALGGWLTLAVALVDFVLYLRTISSDEPGPLAIAVLERIALLLVLGWMWLVAWRAQRA